MGADLGNGEVPGGGAPTGGVVAEQPFGVLFAQWGELVASGGGEVGGAQVPEVVVVHADGGVDGDALLAAAGDEGAVGVFAAFKEAADVLDVVQSAGRGVAAVGGVAGHVEIFGGPGGLVQGDAPAKGADLGVFQGRVNLVEELVDGLGIGTVAVGSAVPVVDDAVGWWCHD